MQDISLTSTLVLPVARSLLFPSEPCCFKAFREIKAKLSAKWHILLLGETAEIKNATTKQIKASRKKGIDIYHLAIKCITSHTPALERMVNK